MDFNTKPIRRYAERNFIIPKRRIHQEETNIVNVCAPDMRASKYIRKVLEDFKKHRQQHTYTRGF